MYIFFNTCLILRCEFYKHSGSYLTHKKKMYLSTNISLSILKNLNILIFLFWFELNYSGSIPLNNDSTLYYDIMSDSVNWSFLRS